MTSRPVRLAAHPRGRRGELGPSEGLEGHAETWGSRGGAAAPVGALRWPFRSFTRQCFPFRPPLRPAPGGGQGARGRRAACMTPGRPGLQVRGRCDLDTHTQLGPVATEVGREHGGLRGARGTLGSTGDSREHGRAPPTVHGRLALSQPPCGTRGTESLARDNRCTRRGP